MSESAIDFAALTPDVISDVLLMACVAVAPDIIATWSRTQQIAAANWGYAIHLSASDNVLNDFCRAHDEDAEYDPPFRCICRPPKPEFLNGFPVPAPFPLLTIGE